LCITKPRFIKFYINLYNLILFCLTGPWNRGEIVAQIRVGRDPGTWQTKIRICCGNSERPR
jgi:hypothetical protein